MHIVEIYPTEVKCICGMQANHDRPKNVEKAAYDHATDHFPAQIRDMRAKPIKTIEIGDPGNRPRQGELFIPSDQRPKP